MNEKKLSVSEINHVCNKVYGEYAQMFSADRLDYKDLALIENCIMKIQMRVEEWKQKQQLK